MKKLKILLIIGVILITTGCFKRDNLEGINIVTTSYPIEYVTSYLYKDHATIASIYPDGIDTSTYSLSKKQLSDYSKKKLFIYNSLSSDKEIAIDFLDRNKNMLIIDASYGMEATNDISELWLNPSNLLMIAQNIRNGLKEYMTNTYLEKEVDSKYEELKLTLSELDAEIKLTAENASRKTVVVNSDALLYLEKYGFEVISLDEDNKTVSDRIINDVERMINSGTVKHIILFEHKDNSNAVNKIITDTNVETFTFRKIDSINDEERNDGKNYLDIMKNNIEILKNELY